jgi:putative membrane protein
MTDLVLAIGHHLLMFALVTVLVMKMMLIRPEMTSAHVTRVGRLDIAFGAIAGLILVVGFARVFYGVKGPNYYLTNLFFWAKIAAVLGVGLLSLPPTIRIIAWRAALRANAAFRPQSAEIRVVRGYMHWEAVVFVLIPVFAALMARGYGAL